MNLNSTLTERDKKLLNMLVFIVIIFIFGWCLIRPLYKNGILSNVCGCPCLTGGQPLD